MTCILAAEGVMAADRRSCGPHVSNMTKLFSHAGSIYATAGDASWGEVFREWIEGGCKVDKRDAYFKLMADSGAHDFMALELNEAGRIVLWGMPWIPVEIDKPIFGIGSGSYYALGAYSAGATIERAIQIASEWDEGTGAEVQTMSIASLKPKRRGK